MSDDEAIIIFRKEVEDIEEKGRKLLSELERILKEKDFFLPDSVLDKFIKAR